MTPVGQRVMALAITAGAGAIAGGSAAPFLPRAWYAGGADPVASAYVDGAITVIALAAWVWAMRWNARQGWKEGVR